MKIKNYFSIIALVMLMFFAKYANASSASTTSAGDIANGSNWTSTPSSADTLYVNHDMTFGNVNWTSSSSMVIIIGSSGSISPSGTNRSLSLPAGSKIIVEIGGEVANNSGNNSNHEISIGSTCIWGKKCCSTSSTIIGLAQLDTLNVCTYDPLPVKLVSFDGRRHDKSITLKWITIEEVLSSYFILERSVDGVHFKQVAKVNSNVNSNSISEYQIEDFLPVEYINTENIFYRLTQFDLDGTSEVLQTISVNSNLPPARVTLLKSSGNGDIIFSVKGYSDEFSIKLSLIDGKELSSFNGHGDLVKISTNDMPCGIIVLTITFESCDYVFTEKILKTE